MRVAKKNSKLDLTVQIRSNQDFIPEDSQLEHWVTAAIPPSKQPLSLTICVVDPSESAALNTQYRQKSGPTNVLAFPYHKNQQHYLGDIVICGPLVVQEAKAQNKELNAHWAHLVIHGCLHLLGYDHINAEDAVVMEQLEIDILTRLHYSNPYVQEHISDE